MFDLPSHRPAFCRVDGYDDRQIHGGANELVNDVPRLSNSESRQQIKSYDMGFMGAIGFIGSIGFIGAIGFMGSIGFIFGVPEPSVRGSFSALATSV